MLHRVVLVAALAIPVAHAQDTNADGCMDTYEPACIDMTVTVDDSATIYPDAVVGPHVALAEGVVVHSHARMEGYLAGDQPQVVGSGSVIGARSIIGHDATIASMVIVGRTTQLGNDATLHTDASIGRAVVAGHTLVMEMGSTLAYANVLGDTVTIGANAVVGNLVSTGSNVDILPGTVLARGVSVGSNSTIGGVTGPEVTFAGNNTVSASARIRKGATIGHGSTVGNNVRVGRDALVGENVTLEAGARLPANVEIGEGCVITAEDRLVRGQILECMPEVSGASTIEAGRDQTCAVTSTGGVACWGNDSHGETLAPTTGSYTAVSSGTYNSCALNDDGHIVCWGMSAANFNIPQTPFAAISTDNNGVCGLTSDGQVSCFGSAYTPSGPLVQFDANQTNRCGIRLDTQAVVCAGTNFAGIQSQIPSANIPMTRVSLGTHSACAVRADNGQTLCWGSSSFETDQPDIDFGEIAIGQGYACGLDDFGAISCWGSSAYGVVTDVPTEGVWTAITSGDHHACAVRDDGVVFCWGRNDNGQLDTPFDTDGDGLSDSGELHAGTDLFRPDTDGDGLSDGDEVVVYGSNPHNVDTDGDGIGDNIEVLGTHPNAFGPSHPASADSDADGVSDPDEALANPATDPLHADGPNPRQGRLSASSVNTCHVDAQTHEIHCWGFDSQGQSTPPDDLFQNAQASYGTNCGIREDHSIACWGPELYQTQARVPDGQYIDVGTGRDGVACAIDMGRRVTCWDTQGSVNDQNMSERLNDIDVGYRAACGTRQSDSTAFCGGSSSYGQTAIPPELATVPFHYLRLSGGSTCGLRADTNELACWGSGDQVYYTFPSGVFESFDLGSQNGCAIDNAGALTCWGPTNAIINDMPTTGVWTEVAVGEGAACATRPDDLVYCWGSTTHGRTDAPMDEDGDGLTDTLEIGMGTDPYLPDSDNDGLSDGDEFHVYTSDPLVFDTDGDGIGDGDEVEGTHPGAINTSSPTRIDSDLDGISDGDEANSLPATDPLVPDAPAPGTSRISFGYDHGCATDLNTQALACWGSDRWNQDSPPNGSFWSSSGQFQTGCGLQTDGTLTCWGRSHWQIAGQEPSGVFAFAAGYGQAACAFDGAGEATCWGSPPIANPTFPPLKAAVGSSIHICGLQLDDNTPYCIGYGNYLVPSQTPTSVPMVDIGVGDRAACGIREDDNTVECWGQQHNIQNAIPTGTFDHIAVGSTNACAIDTTGALQCWGYSATGAVTDHPSSGVWVDVVAGPNAFCATRDDTLIACWGSADLTAIPFDADNDGLTDSDEILLGTNPYVADTDGDTLTDGDEVHTFGSSPLFLDTDGDGIDDNIELDGTHPGAISVSDPAAADSDGDSITDGDEALGGTHPLVPDQPYAFEKTLSTGNSTACVIEPNTQQATCWGSNSAGQASPPTTPFLGISANGTSCGRRLDGTLECWGSTSSGAIADAPTHLVSMVDTNTSQCAVSPRGNIDCWGSRNPFAYGPQLDAVTMVSSSYYAVCGLRVSDSTPVCYGQDIQGSVSQAPTGTVPLKALDQADGGVCGVRIDTGALECWGAGASVTQAPIAGQFHTVAISSLHGCALDVAGGIECWGSDYEGSVSDAPATGTWVAVDVGYRYGCATRDDGLVHCWGDDQYGQTSPPMDADNDGLTDSDEITAGSDPYVQDTDNDGLLDGEEVNTYGTNPNLSDTDGDGIDDIDELDGSFPGALAPSDPNIVDTDADGTTDLEEAQDGTDPYAPDAPNPYVSSINTDDSLSCAVAPSTGEMTCWGSSTYGVTSPPNETYWNGGIGYNFACGILDDNSVDCWGFTAFGVPSSEPSGSFTAVDGGNYFACALEPSGNLQCWGSSSHFGINGSFEPLRQMDIALYSLCGLNLHDQTPICYGSNSYRHIVDTPTDVPMIDIGTGHNAACGIRADNGSVLCWGQQSDIENNVPSGTFKKVDVGRTHACAIDTDDDLHCWGSLPSGTHETPPMYGEWHDLSLATSHACAETTDGGIACWGSDTWNASTPPFDSDGDGMSDNDELHAGGDPFVLDGDGDGLSDRDEIEIYFSNPTLVDSDGDGLDDYSEVFGTTPGAMGPSNPNRLDGDSDGISDVDEIANGTNPGLPNGAYYQAQTTAAGNYKTCRVSPTGVMDCVGTTSQGVTNPPATLFWSIDVEQDAACGITRAGTIECWGSNQYNLLTPPSGQYAMVTTGRGNGTACAMESNGNVVCWGYTTHTGVHPFTEPMTDIDFNHGVLCGLRASDGLPECIGGTSFSGYVLAGPTTQRPFSDISLGYTNGCGIVQATNELDCWGNSQYGVTSRPSGTYAAVANGGTYACAIPLSGPGIDCWGREYQGTVSGAPTTGNFVTLTSGETHSCALRDDGIEVCWGTNFHGESTVP